MPYIFSPPSGRPPAPCSGGTRIGRTRERSVFSASHTNRVSADTSEVCWPLRHTQPLGTAEAHVSHTCEWYTRGRSSYIRQSEVVRGPDVRERNSICKVSS